MTTEINYQTAETWLKNNYKGVPGIWEQFDLELAAISLTENALYLNYDSFNNFTRLALMCIMADAKM